MKATFPIQLALSVLAVGGLVAVLRLSGSQTEAGSSPQAPAPAVAPPAPQLEKARAARDLVPADAWLVADFDGQLLGPHPFQGQLEGECAILPAPARVAVAASSSDGASSVRLILAVPGASQMFLRCAREKILEEGGQEVGSARGFAVLRSKSGVLLSTPTSDLLFSTEPDDLEMLVRLARAQEPSAASGGAHRTLLAETESPDDPLRLSLTLPADWLSGAGPLAAESPLRFLRGGTLLAKPTGTALATLDCAPEGCQELLEFLARVRGDLSTSLPPAWAAEAKTALSAQLATGPEGTPHLSVTWDSPRIPFSTLAKSLLDLVSGPEQQPTGSGP